MRWLWLGLVVLWVGCAQPSTEPSGPFVKLVLDGQTHNLVPTDARFSVPPVAGPSDWSLRAGELSLSGQSFERGGLSELKGKQLDISKCLWGQQDLGPGTLEIGDVDAQGVVSGIFRTRLAHGSFQASMVFTAYP